MKVFLNVLISRSFDTNAGVAQGSILGRTLLPIFNVIPDVICSQVDIFVDETTIFSCSNSKSIVAGCWLWKWYLISG